jgi:hypothetical protein
MEELMRLLSQYQGMNQQGGRFGLNLPPNDISNFRVNPTRGYLAQDGGVITTQPQPVAPPMGGIFNLPYLPSTGITSPYPLSLQQGGTARRPQYRDIPIPRNENEPLRPDELAWAKSMAKKNPKPEYWKYATKKDFPNWSPEQIQEHNAKLDQAGLLGKVMRGGLEFYKEQARQGEKNLLDWGDWLYNNKALEQERALGVNITPVVTPYAADWQPPIGPGRFTNMQNGGTIGLLPTGTTPYGRSVNDVITPKEMAYRRASYITSYLELGGGDRFKSVPNKTIKKLDDVERVRAEAWNEFLRVSKLGGKKATPELMDTLLWNNEGVPGIDIINAVPQAGLGKFFKKVGKGIWEGVKGAADTGLSILGAPNIIDDTFVDRSKFMTNATSLLGKVGGAALTLVAPPVGLAFGAARGLLGGLGGANLGAGNQGAAMGMPGMDFSGMGYSEPQYTSNFGQGIFGRQPLMFKNGGFVNLIPEGFTAIQTERYKGKRERIVHPDGTITEVNAELPHEKMKKDFVTDIVAEGSYVASARPDMSLSALDLSEIIVDIKNKAYREGFANPTPEEITADSLLKKREKKITPTEYAARIAEKFSTTDERHDVFAAATNQENIANRIPYIKALAQVGEKNRMQKEQQEVEKEFGKGGIVQKLGYSDGSPFGVLPFIRIDGDTIDMSATGRPLVLIGDNGEQVVARPYSGTHKIKGAKSITEVPIMQRGGYVRKYQQGGGTNWGDIAGIAATALPAIMGLFGGGNRQGGATGTLDPMTNTLLMGSMPLNTLGIVNNVRAQQSSLNNALGNLGNLNNDLMSLNNQGTMAGIGAQLAQNTDLPRLQLDFSRLQGFNTTTPRSFINAAETPLMSTSSLLSSVGGRDSASILANENANRMTQRNNVAMTQFNQDRSLGYDIANRLTEGMNAERQYNNQLSQQEIAAKNNVFANIGSELQGNFSNRGNILSDTFTQGTNLDMQLAQLSGQIPMAIGQNMMNMGALRAQLQAQAAAAGQPEEVDMSAILQMMNTPAATQQLPSGQLPSGVSSTTTAPFGTLPAGSIPGVGSYGAYTTSTLPTGYGPFGTITPGMVPGVFGYDGP